MRPSLSLRILAAAGALTIALAGLVVREARARAGGEEVVLAMEAVDPRNLLTGHYVQLSLTERLPAGQACPADPATQGWIALRPDGARHRFAGAADTREAAARLGAPVLRGRADCLPDAVTLNLGVDRFHASQTEAEAIEAVLRALRPGDPPVAFAVISAGRDGRARLKAVIVEGRRIELGWL